MNELTRYRHLVSDSARWKDFPFRPGDVVISTPAKCGTTWMQTLCVMLVLDTVQFERPLTQISPWLDMLNIERDAVIRSLETQEHRRVIKTHTPLDGLPFDERATYICVGRDPRDVALSFEHHMTNLNLEVFMAARAAAVGLEDLGPPPAPLPADAKERFWLWATADPGSGLFIGPSLAEILHHFQTFWDQQASPHTAMFHYSDLLADLPGELRHLADVLGIVVTDDRLAEYAAAGTFDSMKRRADNLVGDGDIWRSNQDFFHSGREGEGQNLLDEDALRRYQGRVAQLVPADLANWAHHGWRGTSTRPRKVE